MQYEYTLAAVIICISRGTSPVTVSSLFVTWISIKTVTTTVVHTVISIGVVITLYNILYYCKVKR